MCQPMPTGLYTSWDIDPETSRFTTWQNKNRSFENMVMSYFQRRRPDCEIETIITTGRPKKLLQEWWIFSSLQHCVRSHGLLLSCQELRPSLTEEVFKRGNKKRELDELRRSYKEEKSFTVSEMWECEWWRLYKTTNYPRKVILQTFTYRKPAPGRNKKGLFTWLRSMRHWSTGKFETQFC